MLDTNNKRKYQVVINGVNFLIKMDGKIQKIGFYTTRFVEAENVEQAETEAIRLIRSDTKLSSMILNQRNDSPVLNVEEIEEVEEIKKLQKQTGYAFYPEEEETS